MGAVEDAVVVVDKPAEEAVEAAEVEGVEAKQGLYVFTIMKIIVTRMDMISIRTILEQRVTRRGRIMKLQHLSPTTWEVLSVTEISLYDRDHRIMVEITT